MAQLFETVLYTFVLLGLFAVPFGISRLIKQKTMIRISFLFFMIEFFITILFALTGMIKDFAYIMSYLIIPVDVVVLSLAVACQTYGKRMYEKNQSQQG